MGGDAELGRRGIAAGMAEEQVRFQPLEQIRLLERLDIGDIDHIVLPGCGSQLGILPFGKGVVVEGADADQLESELAQEIGGGQGAEFSGTDEYPLAGKERPEFGKGRLQLRLFRGNEPLRLSLESEKGGHATQPEGGIVNADRHVPEQVRHVKALLEVGEEVIVVGRAGTDGKGGPGRLDHAVGMGKDRKDVDLQAEGGEEPLQLQLVNPPHGGDVHQVDGPFKPLLFPQHCQRVPGGLGQQRRRGDATIARRDAAVPWEAIIPLGRTPY